MTTLAMIFGMVPLAFSVSEGSEQRAPLGQAVIGGVITSTVLTLLVIPTFYLLIARRTGSLPRKLNETFETPPETRA